MRLHCNHITTKATLVLLLLFFLSARELAQSQTIERSRTGDYSVGYHIAYDDLRTSAQGHYPGSPTGGSPFTPADPNFNAVFPLPVRS